MINAVRDSENPRAEFVAVVWKLVTSGGMPQTVYLPSCDIEASSYSTFNMFNPVYKARKAFQVNAQDSC